MNFLLQTDGLIEVQVEPNLIESSFRFLRVLYGMNAYLWPILTLLVILIFAFQKKIREPEKIMFRYGVFVFIIGIFQIARYAHAIAESSRLWGMAPPNTPLISLIRGIELFSMYTGVSLVAIMLSLITRTKQEPTSRVTQ